MVVVVALVVLAVVVLAVAVAVGTRWWLVVGGRRDAGVENGRVVGLYRISIIPGPTSHGVASSNSVGMVALIQTGIYGGACGVSMNGLRPRRKV